MTTTPIHTELADLLCQRHTHLSQALRLLSLILASEAIEDGDEDGWRAHHGQCEELAQALVEYSRSGDAVAAVCDFASDVALLIGGERLTADIADAQRFIDDWLDHRLTVVLPAKAQ